MAMPIIFQLSKERHILLIGKLFHCIVCFICYTVHLWPRWSSNTDFNNMNTIFITYFVSVTFVKCCIPMKEYIQYCLDGLFWVCRSWPNPGTTIPTWDCETCCSPVWIRYTSPQVSNWKKPYMCQCVGTQSCPWPMWLRDMMVFQTHEGNRQKFPIMFLFLLLLFP